MECLTLWSITSQCGSGVVDKDAASPKQAVKRLLASAASKDKQLKVFPGGFHELLMGPEKIDAVATLRNWILEHASEPSVTAKL